MTFDEQKILEDALSALKDKLVLPEHTVICKKNKGRNSYTLMVQIMGVTFECEVKNNITTATAGAIVTDIRQRQLTTSTPILLIGKYISPTVMDTLATDGINSLDSVGNCHICHKSEGNTIFYIRNKGEKNLPTKEKTYPLFQEAGIKVIFYLLLHEENANKPYREIQKKTGLSLGTIKNILDMLVGRNFLLQTQQGRLLKNRKALLDLWVENYNHVLKPKLLLGKMAFRTTELRTEWQTITLPEGMYWGGESAANLTDGYLTPSTFEIYTDIPMGHLMKTGAVRQETNGEISIYHKFWHEETTASLAPTILIYADLMGSGSSRCIEAAQRIMTNELSDYK